MKNKLIQEQLYISEIFHSIQGESTYAGLPCWFIRLAGCNLNCSYCDTKYALSRIDAKKMKISEIINSVNDSNCKLVEITGGEPLMQPEVNLLAEELIKNKFKVLIETNGTFPINQLPYDVIKILDCKCPSSGESKNMLFENFEYISNKDEVKFVISDKIDYDYAVNIIDKYLLHSKTENILFSPVYTEKHKFAAQLVQWMIDDNIQVRINMQLHKILWSQDERGR
jgi:7-carboxy-7-deazaguanine synthase